MIDIKYVRENQSSIEESLKNKDKSIILDSIVKADLDLRELTKRLNDLQSEQNKQSKEIGVLKSQGKSDESVFSKLKELSKTIKDLEGEYRDKSTILNNMLLEIPNVPHSSVPIGESDKENVVTKDCPSKKKIDFNPKNHVDIAQDLDLIDFERGAKMSGAGFPLYKGNGALLERALINFMIDFHLKNYNYTEFFTPFLVRPDSATTTGVIFFTLVAVGVGKGLGFARHSEHPNAQRNQGSGDDGPDLPEDVAIRLKRAHQTISTRDSVCNCSCSRSATRTKDTKPLQHALKLAAQLGKHIGGR